MDSLAAPVVYAPPASRRPEKKAWMQVGDQQVLLPLTVTGSDALIASGFTDPAGVWHAYYGPAEGYEAWARAQNPEAETVGIVYTAPYDLSTLDPATGEWSEPVRVGPDVPEAAAEIPIYITGAADPAVGGFSVDPAQVLEAPEASEPAEPILIDIPEVLLQPSSFLAGSAGTGKTYLARAMQRQLTGTVLAATTGIASVNLGEGTTINALLKYFDTASLRDNHISGQLQAQLGRLWRAGIRRILLDEVSMMDGAQLTILTEALDELAGRGYAMDAQLQDEMDEADAALGIVTSDTERRAPIALTLIGDFAQLPPVKAPFAFESAAWPAFAAATHTLTKIWRQSDQDFVRALHAARRGDADGVLAFFASRLVGNTDPEFDGPTIMATNQEVERFNGLRLATLQTPPGTFRAERWGVQRGDWKNIPDAFVLKAGALVMLLSNAREQGLDGMPGPLIYANGDLAVVEAIDPERKQCVVTLQRNGRTHEVRWTSRNNTIPMEPGRRKALKLEGHPERISEDGRMETVGSVLYLPVRVAYATTVHKCVSGETRIPLHGWGYQPITAVPIGHVTPYGVVKGNARTLQPAWRITTARGYTVVCSAEHRWMTKTGLKPTTALNTADAIELNTGPSFPGQVGIHANEAWWLGATVGDGCYTDTRDGSIHFACADVDQGERYKEIGETTHHVRISWRRDRKGLHLTSWPLRRRLQDMGLDFTKAPHKRIPKAVWAWGPEQRGAFLQGLFDTDGHIGRHRIILTTASEKLGEDVQEMLLTLGVVSTRRSYVSGYKARGDRYWQVYVGAESYDRFARCVGFSLAAKAKKLQTSAPNRALNPTLGFDTVASVDPLGLTIPMYDIEIEAPHLLTFGPFVGHNSQGLSLDKVQVNTRAGFFKTPGMLYVALSRARTAEGLRVVGSVDGLRERCTVDARVRPWL